MKRALVAMIAVLTIATLVLGDVLTAFAQDAGPSPQVVLVPALPETLAEPGDIKVAQLFGGGGGQKRRKRRSLMDMLFGDDEDGQIIIEEAPRKKKQQQQPQSKPKRQKKAALPAPKKPAIEKAATATRLAVMGDSMATDVAAGLERFFAEDPNLVVVPMGVGSSGFVRPDHFDWTKTLDEEIAKNSFDLAVVVMGINDNQSLRADDKSHKALTEGWTQNYRSRLTTFVSKFRAANKPVIWIGLPPMSKSSFSQAMSQISNLQRLAVFAAGGEFVDIYERFLDEEGKYSSFGPDLNGKRVRMRKEDGIHFSAGGADKLAFYLSQPIKLFYRGGGGVGIEVADPLNGTDAQVMLRPPYQGLGQLRLLEIAGAVIPLNQTPKRATDLLLAGSSTAPAEFDLELLVNAPAGRADAFGVGQAPAQNASGR